MMADQMRHDRMGSVSPGVLTPALDRLAAQGVRFSVPTARLRPYPARGDSHGTKTVEPRYADGYRRSGLKCPAYSQQLATAPQ